MSHTIRIHETGGPEVLRWDEVDLPSPQVGEVRLRQTAVGVNFIDTYHRSGLYPVGGMPSGIGVEGAGVVEEVGEGVSELNVGDRVAYAGGPLGSYATDRTMPVETIVRLPDDLQEKAGGGDSVEGSHDAIPRTWMSHRSAGRDDFDPGGRGWSRFARLPVGEAPRSNSDRHRGIPGKGRACCLAWLRPSDSLPRGRLRATRP